MGRQNVVGQLTLTVDNIGGIQQTEVSLVPGVNILVGENATNRTSLLRSLCGVLGGDEVYLKGDADEGTVVLDADDHTWTRTLKRTDNGITKGGNPYSTDVTAAELFAFLLESNEVRQAVARNQDLHDLVMRPIDTASLNAKISNLETEKRDLQSKLDELDRLQSRLPKLEQKRTKLQREVQEIVTELEGTQSTIESHEAALEDEQETKHEIEQKIDALQERRSEVDQIQSRITDQKNRLEALEDERIELEERLENFPDISEHRGELLKEQIEDLRREKRKLDSLLSQLQNLIQFNEEMLKGDSSELLSILRDDDVNPFVTSRLLPNQEESNKLTCWTCGAPIEQADIQDTLENLRKIRQTQFEKRDRIEDELDEATTERDTIESTQERVNQINSRLEQLSADIKETETTIQQLDMRRESTVQEVERLEKEVASLREHNNEKLLGLHEKVGELRRQQLNLERELESVDEKITSIENELDSRTTIESRHEEVSCRLQECRNRADRVRKNAIEVFNDSISEILDILEYDNIERIWLEQRRDESKSGNQSSGDPQFDLHVVRKTPGGASYEDTIDHLSESEREVTALTFALAGYLAHDIHETIPFILLDSLEAIDANRIASLVDYLESYATYTIVALLPGDAAALSDSYNRIDDM